MYFFDNELLKKYLQTGERLQVYANKEFLTITNESDIEDSTYGVGVDTSGKSIPFSYKEISIIKIGGFDYSIDMLQKSFETNKDSTSKENPKNDNSDKKQTKTDKTESIDRIIMNIDSNSRYYGSSGPVELIYDGMITYKTFVDGRYSSIVVEQHLTKPMEIITKI